MLTLDDHEHLSRAIDDCMLVHAVIRVSLSRVQVPHSLLNRAQINAKLVEKQQIKSVVVSIRCF